MTYKVDGLKLFLPYILSKFDLGFTGEMVKRLYLDVEDYSDYIALELDYVDTDLFRKMEYNLRMQGYIIIDNSSTTIAILIPMNPILKGAALSFLSGNFSHLRHNIEFMKPYMDGKELGDLKEDLILKIITRNKEFKAKIEERIGCSLRDDAELGCMTDIEFYKLTNRK